MGKLAEFACITLVLAGGCYVPVGKGVAESSPGNGSDGGSSSPADQGPPDLMPRPADGAWIDPYWRDPVGMRDLTVEGTLDWVHWGMDNEHSVDHRAGVTPKITATPIGTAELHQYTDNHIVFNWNDGTPSTLATQTPTGIFIEGVANGFSLQVPADANAHTLRVYLSSFGADYQLTAHISDGSLPDYVDTQSYPLGANGLYRVYTFAFKSAAPGATFQVSWVNLLDHYGGANVTLQAATFE
jgi:hypothetical protein